MSNHTPSQTEKTKHPKFILSIMAILGIWLVCLLALASWYQANYIQNFTHNTPDFLDSAYTEDWLTNLATALPPKTTETRVIQLWKPNCLCNRFAQRHALNTINTAKSLKVEHLTIIPNTHAAELESLQSLNPDTHVISLDTKILKKWPASPSVFIQGPLNQLLYFGPLGFGAFCGQSSSDVIAKQLRVSDKPNTNPFFNVIGKGCFCSWDD